MSTITASRDEAQDRTGSDQPGQLQERSRFQLPRHGCLRRHRADAEGARVHGGVDPRRPRGLQEDRSREAGARARRRHVRGQQGPLLDDGRARHPGRRSPGLPRRRDAVGRRHDRRRDDRPVPERVRALADLPQHQLDLLRGQARVPAPRSGGCDLGPAGVHEGRRPESRRPTTSRCSATTTRSCRKAGRSRRRSSTRTSRWTRPEPAAGPRSSATSSTARTRAAATAQTPVRTTSRNRDSRRQTPGSPGSVRPTRDVAARRAAMRRE